MPLLPPEEAPLDMPLLPDEPDPLDDPEPLLDDPLDDEPDEEEPLEDIELDAALLDDDVGVPLLEAEESEVMESLDPLLDGVCVVPEVLLVKAPVV